jgi:hypothetical protein
MMPTTSAPASAAAAPTTTRARAAAIGFPRTSAPGASNVTRRAYCSTLSPAHADFLDAFAEYAPVGAVVAMTTRTIKVCDGHGRGVWTYYLNSGNDAGVVGVRLGKEVAKLPSAPTPAAIVRRRSRDFRG